MRTRRSCVVVAIAVAVGLGGCSSSAPKSAPPESSSTTNGATAAVATGPRVIIDTDFSRWWDDVTAIGMANVLEQQGKLNVLGIVSDVPNRIAVAGIDAIDTAYGHHDIPLGAVAGSDADTAKHGYTDALVEQLPHEVRSSDDVPKAVDLYRRLLAQQPDHSVVIVSLGAYTNLAGLLASPADRALITKKVKRLVIMDGVFPVGFRPATNQALDLAAARVVVAGGHGGPWPIPIAWVDGLDGIATRVGGTLCTATSKSNPMRIVFEDLFTCGKVGDGDWDGPALLYAVGDTPAAFKVEGRGGAAFINQQGGLGWHMHSSRPDDYYVHVADQKLLNRRINQLLVTQPHGPR